MSKISVITPSYNQAEFLEETIHSVLSQNYPNLEYIIMDGGSTDGSLEILKKYEKHFSYWQSQRDGGQSAAINAGMAKATGEILCWLNSDDLFTPDALNSVAEHFHNNPSSLWCAGDSLQFEYPSGREWAVTPKSLCFDKLVDWNEYQISQPSVFWKKELWNRTGGLNKELELALDFDLWLKFAELSEGTIINSVLSKARIHKDAKTKSRLAESFVETCLVLDRHGMHELSKERLLRIAENAFKMDKALSFITRNSLYRKWRESRWRKND